MRRSGEWWVMQPHSTCYCFVDGEAARGRIQKVLAALARYQEAESPTAARHWPSNGCPNMVAGSESVAVGPCGASRAT